MPPFDPILASIVCGCLCGCDAHAMSSVSLLLLVDALSHAASLRAPVAPVREHFDPAVETKMSGSQVRQQMGYYYDLTG